MLELYHHGTSVCAAKVRFALMEKGLEWEGHYVDILKGEQFAPDYMKLNPRALVPTLVHDGRVVLESTLISEYLDEVFPKPPLKPLDPWDRVQMRLWTKRVDEELHPACAVITFAISHRHVVLANPPAMIEEYINKTGPARREARRQKLMRGIDAPEARDAIRLFDRFLADMETALSHREWLAGERFSLADIGVIPYVNRLEMLGLSEMWTLARPHLAGWFARMKARASFQSAIFGYLPPELGKMMKERGAEAWPQVREILKAAA